MTRKLSHSTTITKSCQRQLKISKGFSKSGQTSTIVQIYIPFGFLNDPWKHRSWPWYYFVKTEPKTKCHVFGYKQDFFLNCYAHKTFLSCSKTFCSCKHNKQCLVILLLKNTNFSYFKCTQNDLELVNSQIKGPRFGVTSFLCKMLFLTQRGGNVL